MPARKATLLAQPVDDPRFVRVVGRHLELHAIADHEPDEPLPHFTGNMGQHRVLSAVELHPKHGPRENSRNRPFNLKAIFGRIAALRFLS